MCAVLKRALDLHFMWIVLLLMTRCNGSKCFSFLFRPLVDDILLPWLSRRQATSHHRATWQPQELAVVDLMDGWGVAPSRPAVVRFSWKPTIFSASEIDSGCCSEVKGSVIEAQIKTGPLVMSRPTWGERVCCVFLFDYVFLRVWVWNVPVQFSVYVRSITYTVRAYPSFFQWDISGWLEAARWRQGPKEKRGFRVHSIFLQPFRFDNFVEYLVIDLKRFQNLPPSVGRNTGTIGFHSWINKE